MRIVSATVTRWVARVLLLLLLPSAADAHPAARGDCTWLDGFSHPWQGWDHLLAMLAIGWWVAQRAGGSRWIAPATFVACMGIGGSLGASGMRLPGMEAVVFASVFVLGGLAIQRIRLSWRWTAGLVGIFGFFHGLAHGVEMPGTANLLTFGLGFLAATLVLHGVGFATAHVLALLTVALLGSSACAQETNRLNGAKSGDAEPVRLPEVVVEGKGDSLLGVANSANQGEVTARQLDLRPTSRVGEVLEAIPGVILTQHAGGGKANQYFLRGFNLDHGTDFATSLDSMPVNLPSHAHGQGYTDLNLLIPELIERVDYQKGVYAAENGDFASAGAAKLQSFHELPHSFARVEGGIYGYARGVFAASPKVGDGHLLYGFEAYHHDGPWRNPDDYQRFNGVLSYHQGDASKNWTVTARGYHGQWDSSDQIASSAVREHYVPVYGSLDDTTGGHSQRYSLSAEWNRAGPDSATQISAYGFFYDFDLFSNFTYFLVDTNRGDQFEQAEKRVTEGLQARHTFFSEWGRREIENSFGFQLRNDGIQNGLYQSQDRQRVEKIDSTHGDFPLAATTRQDDISQTSVGIYYESKVQWSDHLRSVAGARGDIYRFDVTSSRAANSDERVAAIGSPKLSVILGPWAKTEVYVQVGLGFHSNDGRGVTSGVDPVTGTRTNLDGQRIQRADPLVRTYGAETGVRTAVLPGLQSTLSVWWLDIDSELVFAGDSGSTTASRPSRRYGIEWANAYALDRHLTVDADLSLSHAAFRDFDPAGRHIPGSIESVLSAGISYRADYGFFSSIRARYFGPRPLTEDNSLRSHETLLVGAEVGCQLNARWTISAEVFNLLDRRDHDIDYAYESRVRPSDLAATQIHFHPVEPMQARVALTARF